MWVHCAYVVPQAAYIYVYTNQLLISRNYLLQVFHKVFTVVLQFDVLIEVMFSMQINILFSFLKCYEVQNVVENIHSNNSNACMFDLNIFILYKLHKLNMIYRGVPL